jgi:hypothetical protein
MTVSTTTRSCLVQKLKQAGRFGSSPLGSEQNRYDYRQIVTRVFLDKFKLTEVFTTDSEIGVVRAFVMY